MINFDALFSEETLTSLGLHIDSWTRGELALLRETMILVGKENPDMTQAEAEEECKEQAKEILFQNFKKQYKLLLRQIDTLQNIDDAFNIYSDLGADAFDEFLETQIEYKSFVERFYSDLREMWNADFSLVRDEFERMKKNKWTMYQYNEYLEELKRKMRMS